jgi:hypothetical protein
VPSICCHLSHFSFSHFCPSSVPVHEPNSDLQENKTCYLLQWDFRFSMQWLWSFMWYCQVSYLYCTTRCHTPTNNKGWFTHSMLYPCRAHAVPLPCCAINSRMPCCAPAPLRQCRVLRERPCGSQKYPNC